MLKKILIALFILLVIAGGYAFYKFKSFAPTYDGQLALAGLKQKVEIKYDTYGIPHIYAANQHDAYLALGYIHAKERLFQMELIRRVAKGRLSEIFGHDMLEVDKLFRTLGIAQKSEELANTFMQSDRPHKQAALAYFKGINLFISQGKLPLEFAILGITPEPFSVEDAFNAAGYMSFGFAEGFKIDPILTRLAQQHGSQYLQDLALVTTKEAVRIKNHPYTPDTTLTQLTQVLDKLPIPLLIGSNSWILGPDKTKSGKPVFENDTHIGYSQPSVWFEAHLEYPGFMHYGHYLAGVPFALLGHNHKAVIGLTMFENDDVDFYTERLNNSNDQAWINNQWEPLKQRTETITVKDSQPVTITVRSTSHGPVVNDIFFTDSPSKQPISAWWSYLHFSKDLLAAIYQLNHIETLADARSGASMIEAPGLNVMYADTEGNIAWWASAKLPIRPAHVNSKLVLDGSSGTDEILGFYPFTKNPQAENPPWGYVYSANNQPDSVDGILYPGYYYPRDRAGKIVALIEQQTTPWTQEDSKRMAGNVTSDVQAETARVLSDILDQHQLKLPGELYENYKKWDGDHQINQVIPSFHYTWLAWIQYYTMHDELGMESLKAINETSLLKSSFLTLLKNKESVWWDDLTTDTKETRFDIIKKSLGATIKTLVKNFESTNIPDWKWGKIHTLTHNHPFGQLGGLAEKFNVGPFPSKGGNEVINNQMFAMDTSGIFKVVAGPAVRTVIDLSDMEGAMGIIPTGQSGRLQSPHYQDQAQMFVDVNYRPQLINPKTIEENTQHVFILTPKNQ